MHHGLLTLALSFIISLSLAFAQAEEAQQGELDPDAQEPVNEQPHPADLERPAALSYSQFTAAEFTRRFPQQLVELTSPPEIFQALYLPANTPTAKGMVIFVPGLHESADAVTHIAQLRRAVTDKGWDSLSLQMPDPDVELLRIESRISESEFAALAPEPAAPTDEEGADSAEPGNAELEEANITTDPHTVTDSAIISAEPVDIAPATQEPATPDYASTVTALLNAALGYAQTHEPQALVFIAQHEGTYWLLNHLAAHKNPPVDAVLLINSRQPKEATQNIAALIAQLDIRLVDIYRNHLTAHTLEAKQRFNASARKTTSNLQQFRINAPSDRLARQQTQAKVLGWLHNYENNH